MALSVQWQCLSPLFRGLWGGNCPGPCCTLRGFCGSAGLPPPPRPSMSHDESSSPFGAPGDSTSAVIARHVSSIHQHQRCCLWLLRRQTSCHTRKASTLSVHVRVDPTGVMRDVAVRCHCPPQLHLPPHCSFPKSPLASPNLCISGIFEWRDFFDSQKKYPRVGVVNDRFYDSWGNARGALRTLEKLRDKGLELRQTNLEVLKQYGHCSTTNTKDSPTYELTCSVGKQKRYLRELLTTHDGKEVRRCVCAREDQFKDALLSVYSDCGTMAERCERPKVV